MYSSCVKKILNRICGHCDARKSSKSKFRRHPEREIREQRINPRSVPTLILSRYQSIPLIWFIIS